MEFDFIKILAISLIAYVWALSEKVRWNYKSTVFSRIKSEKFQKWMNPSGAVKSRGKVLDLLFLTVLFWCVDLRRFIKTLLLFIIFFFIWKLLPEDKWYLQIAAMFFIYLVTFELTYSIDWFWWIKDKKKE
jgi:hypothetical protein